MVLNINRTAYFHKSIYLYETHHVPISDAKVDTFIDSIHPPKPTFQYDHQYKCIIHETRHFPISDAKVDTFIGSIHPPKPTFQYNQQYKSNL